MASGISAFGSLFNWNAVDIAEIQTIGGPSQSMSEIEVTHHASTNGFRDFVAGLRDGGEITLEGNFIKTDTTGQVAMHTDFQAGTARTWILKLPGWAASAPQWTGSGYVKAFSVNLPFDGKLGFSATIRLTGKPTFTAA